MAGSFIHVTLKDGSTHTVIVPENSTAEGLVGLAAKGQSWPGGGWIEVEGGGAVSKRLVAADQIVVIELFERP